MGALRHLPPIWLDVTRLLTRVGRSALTGIDRVELAYLREALTSGCGHYLCRTTRGYLLLGPQGAQCLLDLMTGQKEPGAADLWSRLTFRGNRPRHRAEAMMRPLAIDRCSPTGLPDLLTRHGSTERAYVNVGHANLSDATLGAFSKAATWSLVMIHDLIPLTHPQVVVDGQPKVFAGRIDRVRRYATHVIATSDATAADLTAHWSTSSVVPTTIISRLGLDPKPPVRAETIPGYFVMLGTIEPRKNHSLMLDAWDLLAQDTPSEAMPTLHIIGAQGWNVADLMARIHAHPLLNRKIFMHGPLPDRHVQAHFARADGLLFPSLAEGYGLPPLEAAMAGVTPICSNLPVFHETLGDCAVYVASADSYQWKETIKQYLEPKSDRPDLSAPRVPTWQEHFETVTDAIIAKHLWADP